MISNLETVKKILQISGTSKDTIIEALLRPVQDFIISYCRNDFRAGKPLYSRLRIEEPYTVITLDSLEVESFVKTRDLLIEGTYFNNGIFERSDYEENSINFEDATKPFYTEQTSEAAYIWNVLYPDGIVPAYALLIGYILNTMLAQGRTSENVGDYSSVTFLDFAPALLKLLSPYRKIKFL